MTNLTRWEPMHEMVSLRDAMDRLFNEAFTRPFFAGTMRTSLPPVDMWQDDNSVIIRAALPGLKADDVQISITGDMLTLRGEYRQKEERNDDRFQMRENLYGSFERSLLLPVPVLSDKAQAQFEDGVLTITLPKSEEIKPKTITVKPK